MTGKIAEGGCAGLAYGKVNVILHTTDTITFPTLIPCGGCQVCIQGRLDFFIDPFRPVFRAKNQMDDNVGQGLRHGKIFGRCL